MSSLIPGPPIPPFTVLGAFSNCSLLVVIFPPTSYMLFLRWGGEGVESAVLMQQVCLDFSSPVVSLTTYMLHTLNLHVQPVSPAWVSDSFIWVPRRNFDLIMSKANDLFPQTSSFSCFS